MHDFLVEIDILLDHVTNKLKDIIIILGDFNIHFDVLERATIDVINVLDNYQLQSVVRDSTHKRGHTLDQIFYDRDNLNHHIEHSVDSSQTVSDHYPIFFTLPYSNENNKSNRTTEFISFRKVNQVDIPAFRQTVLNNLEPWYSRGSDLDNFSELCANFKNNLQLALDHHAPLQTKKLTPKPTMNPHWFDAEYMQERRKRRSLERKYKQIRTTEYKQLLSEQRDK